MLNTDGAGADETVVKVRISTNQNRQAGREASDTSAGESGNMNSTDLGVHVNGNYSSVHIHHTTEGDNS